MPRTALTALRRQQLVDVARAYEVAIPAGGTKQQILPPMITAEQQGVFRRQPKHPWYLQKAARTSDIPYVDIGDNPELAAALPEAAPVVNLPRRKESDYHRKQKALKDIGINAFGMTKHAVNDLAAENGIS